MSSLRSWIVSSRSRLSSSLASAGSRRPVRSFRSRSPSAPERLRIQLGFPLRLALAQAHQPPDVEVAQRPRPRRSCGCSPTWRRRAGCRPGAPARPASAGSTSRSAGQSGRAGGSPAPRSCCLSRPRPAAGRRGSGSGRLAAAAARVSRSSQEHLRGGQRHVGRLVGGEHLAVGLREARPRCAAPRRSERSARRSACRNFPGNSRRPGGRRSRRSTRRTRSGRCSCRRANPPEKHWDIRDTTRTPGSSIFSSSPSWSTVIDSPVPHRVISLFLGSFSPRVPWSVT